MKIHDLIVAAALTAVAGSAAANNINCLPLTVADRQAARQFWTEEAKEDASPADMPMSLWQNDEVRYDFPGPQRSFSADRLRSWAAQALLFSLPPVSTPKKSKVALDPFRTAGRLFFKDARGNPDWCTASFTGDPHVLMTAAHCVDSGSGFFSGLLFTRAYVPKGGENFSIMAVGTVREWRTSANADLHDYAFLRTQDPTTVTPLQFASIMAIGWMAVAYPNEIIENGVPLHLGGSTMMHADGTAGIAKAGTILMEGVPLKKGSSGGPWIPPGPVGASGTTLLSVASRVTPAPHTLLGSAITKRTLELFERVKAKCSTD